MDERKIQFYAAWKNQLPMTRTEMDAVANILKNADVGLEMETIEIYSIDKLKRWNIKYSSHNPMKFFGVSLSDPGFLNDFALEKNGNLFPRYNKDFNPKSLFYAINNSDTGFASFHIYNSKNSFEKMYISSRVRERFADIIANNLNGFNRFTEKKILFENQSYNGGHASEKASEIKYNLTDPAFWKELLEKTPKAGFLPDIAHLYVSGQKKMEEGLFKGTIDDYFDNVIECTNGRIYGIHFAIPILSKEMCHDSQKAFSMLEENEEYNNLFFQYARKIMENNPVSTFTLDMDFASDRNNGSDHKMSPKQQAISIAEHAEYARKRLNLPSVLEKRLEEAAARQSMEESPAGAETYN
jgi:hypothetical protein